jgi:succinate-semialdehyde dehydrogenase/glutarate-semialdehyde dehydrogenase
VNPFLNLQDPDLFREGALIGGEWLSVLASRGLRVLDPARAQVVGEVPMLGRAATEKAIRAASDAFPSWRRLPAAERSAILLAFARLMIEHIEDLAVIMTMEQGKPLEEARSEVRYAAAFASWFAEEGKRAYGETIPSPWVDRRLLVLREPVGVVAAITPWNFPSAMVTRKMAPALAAGCTVILKPAEQTPFSALALAVLLERAGLPSGALNVVTGDAVEIGQTLCSSPTVRKLTFTGSTEVGRLLMEQCADTVKKLSLELGGNAPFIVLDDADLGAAVKGALASKFRNAGQTCVCANRFLIQDGIFDAFADRLAEAARALKPGFGLDAGVTQGPIIDEAGVAKVERLVADAISGGARIITGGQRASAGRLFYEPTVLTSVTNSMSIAQEEVFGPVAPLTRFATDQEAIELANGTEYGLAAYIYGQNLSRLWRVMEALEFGIVGVNSGVVSTEVAPFGGVKQSGIGREGGRAGLEEFPESKYICLGEIPS